MENNIIDVNKKNDGYWTGFHTACNSKYIKIIEYMLKDYRININ